jgi:erythromycin esterase
MGFDVLAFESGLFEVHKVWELIEGGEDVRTAMSQGVFSIWMGSAEVDPLVEYLDEAAGTANPLELAGFDCQFTGTASRDYLVDDLTDFLTGHGAAIVTGDEWDGFTAAFQGVMDGEWWQEKPTEAVKDSLKELLGRVRSEVEAFSAGEEEAFWAQLLGSLEEQLEFIWHWEHGEWRPQVSTIRDMQMGDNLLWLANVAYPERKVIVWAATLHVARVLEGIDWVNSTASYAGYTTMGQVVWDGIGTDAYAIGFTAGEGQVGSWRNEPWQLPPPEEGSLEEAFMHAGFQNAFLDLRAIPAGGEWLSRYLLSRPMGYSWMRASWPRHMDAVIFTRVMQPSTPLN